jgi:YfiH family protein
MRKFKIFRNYKKIFSVFSDKSVGNIDFRFGEREIVLANRKKMADKLGIDLKNLYEMEQVHGSRITIIDKTMVGKNMVPQTDALVTKLSGVFLMVKTADCFPVLLFDSVKNVIACVHVGWRGAIQKIFLETLLVMINNFSCDPKDILVAIGPGARKCCFVHNHFIQEKLPEWKKYISGKEKFKTLDLVQFIKDKFINYGIKTTNMEDSGICTIGDDEFFSHFRSLRNKELEGRFATIIGIKNIGIKN